MAVATTEDLVETPNAGIDQLVKNGDVNDSLHEGTQFLRRQLQANTPSASPSLSHSPSTKPSPSIVTVLTTLNATTLLSASCLMSQH